MLEHTPLQSLYYAVKCSRVVHLCGAFVDGLIELQRCRPELHVARLKHFSDVEHYSGMPNGVPFWNVMLAAKDPSA